MQGERTLPETALCAEAGAVFGNASGDHRLHAERPDEAIVLVVVVATVAEHHVGRRRGLPRLPRTGGTASSSGMSWVTSLLSPPVGVTASGRPVTSVIRWRLLSDVPQSAGLRPFSKPQPPQLRCCPRDLNTPPASAARCQCRSGDLVGPIEPRSSEDMAREGGEHVVEGEAVRQVCGPGQGEELEDVGVGAV